MPLRLVGSNLLAAGGELAISDDCCCEDCTLVVAACNQYVANGVRGVAGTQPSVSISISGVASEDSYEPCTKECEGCESYYNGLTIVLTPCSAYTDQEEGQVLCTNGGLVGGPAIPIDAWVEAGYCIEVNGTETVAFVVVAVYTGGRGACETGTRDGKIYKFHLAVTTPETYAYDNCDDPTLTTSLPGQITGTFTAGWGSYTPASVTRCHPYISAGLPSVFLLDSDSSRGCDFSGTSVSVTVV